MKTSSKHSKSNQFKHNLKATLAYVRLQTVLGFKQGRKNSKKSTAFHWIFVILAYCFFLFLFWFLFKQMIKQTVYIKAADLPILIFTISEIFIFIYSIVQQCKRTLNPYDLRTILIMPLSNFQRYVGEIITIFIKVTIFNFVLFYPIAIVYGLATGLFNLTFFFTSMLAVLIMPLFPFALSVLLSTPFICLFKVLKDKQIIKFILFLIVFVGILVAYALILSFLSDWYVHAKTDKEVMKAIANVLKQMNDWYNPAYYCSSIALSQNIGASFGIHTGTSIGLIALGMAASYPIYKKFTLTEQNGSRSQIRKIKFDGRNPYTSTYVKDFKQICRTPSYLYFFIGVAICMPILTFLITDIIKKLGESRVGPETFFGLTLFIVMIVTSTIGCFSANLISREQNQFYMSKVAPINIKGYLTTKASVVFTVASIGILLCCSILAATSTRSYSAVSRAVLTPTNIGVIFAANILFLIGICFNGLNINLARPAINLEGEANESNVGIQLAISIIISILISFFALLSSSVFGKQTFWLYVLIIVFVFIYALVNFLVFMLTANKRFRKIEVK